MCVYPTKQRMQDYLLSFFILHRYSSVPLCFASSPVECSRQSGVPYQGSLDLSANYPALTVIHSLVA